MGTVRLGRRPGRTRRPALLAAMALAAVALVACTPLTPAPPKRTATEALHVDVVGDSLVRQAGPYIERRLNLAGFPTPSPASRGSTCARRSCRAS